MTPEPPVRDAFAQLCRDLAAEQRHARPERTRREAGPQAAAAGALRELVDAVEPSGRRDR